MREKTCHGGIHLGHKISIRAFLGCEDMPQHTSTGRWRKKAKWERKIMIRKNEVLLRLDQGGGRNLLAMLDSASRKRQRKPVLSGSRWWAKWRHLAVEKSVTGHDEGQIKQRALKWARWSLTAGQPKEWQQRQMEWRDKVGHPRGELKSLIVSMGVYDEKRHNTLLTEGTYMHSNMKQTTLNLKPKFSVIRPIWAVYIW